MYFYYNVDMLTSSDFYKKIFSCKVYKISIDAGCTCPNRDGSKAYGGCIFCSERGSGDFASGPGLSVQEQIKAGKALVEKKLKGRSGNREGKYLAYFQNFTSTYGDLNNLVKKYREALTCPGVAGLCIATRPDCLGEDILQEIAELSKNHFVQLELGLQTASENTGKFINRCYSNEDYQDAVKRIKKAAPSVHIVSHLIFGLPGEDSSDMMKSLDFVIKTNTAFKDYFGLKITVLYILQKARLAALYREGKYKPLSKEEYYSLIKAALERLPEECVLHRLTGDPPKNLLIEPEWTKDKKKVMNEMEKIKELYLLPLKPFNMENLPQIVNLVEDMWSPSSGDRAFRRIYVEYVVRHNISENEYHYELAGKDGLVSAAFFTRKGDACKVDEWFKEKISSYSDYSDELKEVAQAGKIFLDYMDQKTLSYMKEDDIKLSLFVSLKKGAGSVILNRICQLLKKQGWKNLYLWTDCECNWQWYFSHGFTLVEEDNYKPYEKDGPYKTYIFSKKLQD